MKLQDVYMKLDFICTAESSKHLSVASAKRVGVSAVKGLAKSFKGVLVLHTYIMEEEITS